MATYKSFIQLLLRGGNSISVYDGEEWAVKRSPSYADIIEAIDSVEESQIRIRNASGDVVGWALLIPVGSDEDVVDYSDNEYMAAIYGKWNS